MRGLAFFIAVAAQACSWDNPIWPKDRRSDTPLFRFTQKGDSGYRSGYIDASGRIAIPARFRVFGNHGNDDFFGGAAVMTDGVFVDIRGQEIAFPYKVTTSTMFSEGLIGVYDRITDQFVGFANRRGKLMIRAPYDRAEGFSEGLSVIVKDGLYGFIDHAGKIVVAPYLLHASAFSDGAARVIAEGPCRETDHGHCGWFNQRVLGVQEAWSQNLASHPRCRYGFIGKNGVPLFASTFVDAWDFAEGLAAVSDGKRMGFVDKQGRQIIPMRYTQVQSFSEGLAAFEENEKWGYLDRAGNVVIPAQFYRAQPFASGAAVVQGKRDEYWFIDRGGHRLFGKSFALASGFHLGLAHVGEGEKGRDRSYIDRTGKKVFSYRF